MINYFSSSERALRAPLDFATCQLNSYMGDTTSLSTDISSEVQCM
jgi:hypothetical protein